MTSIITDLAERKGKACPVCLEMHVPQNRCRYEQLAGRITKLSQANQLIPSILQANKEAVTMAEHYRHLLKTADQAQTILQEVLAKHGDIGKQIQDEYMEAVDKWASQLSSQDTKEPTSDTDNSAASEKNDKPCTEETTTGENSPPAS